MKFYKKSVITRGDNVPYLIRYSIFYCRWFSIKIHNILESDDACLHNHPWAFISIILWGGYTEHSVKTPWSNFWSWIPGPEEPVAKYYRAGSVLHRPADFKHKLEITKPTWTFVITFKRVQDWGFFTPKGFINWRQYHQNKEGRCE